MSNMGTKRGVALPTPAPDPFLASGGERCGFWRKLRQGGIDKNFVLRRKNSLSSFAELVNELAPWADDSPPIGSGSASVNRAKAGLIGI
jgi:hypothetical protein